MKAVIKTAARGIFLTLLFPFAALSGFGRILRFYTIGAHACALIPGRIGDYMRTAFYRLTLDSYSLSSLICFGSFFANPQARVAADVYIGSYCVIGKTSIGARTQIASGVQILSGRRQHFRDEEGQLQSGEFRLVSIGEDCWIGAAAIVMTDVGTRSTVGAGSVVTKPIPPDSVAVGNPAKVIQTLTAVE